MNYFNVPWAVFKVVIRTATLYYFEVSADGPYFVTAGKGDGRIIACEVVAPEDIADFQSSLKSSATHAASTIEAVASASFI